MGVCAHVTFRYAQLHITTFLFFGHFFLFFSVLPRSFWRFFRTLNKESTKGGLSTQERATLCSRLVSVADVEISHHVIFGHVRAERTG